jgi:hypothetical protein
MQPAIASGSHVNRGHVDGHQMLHRVLCTAPHSCVLLLSGTSPGHCRIMLSLFTHDSYSCNLNLAATIILSGLTATAAATPACITAMAAASSATSTQYCNG